ncbi:metallophosphoesterase [Tateyamaria pelophila]|uniref:metallophosphoesterase n=1 Tax=Tateyamaria pelophila TaxID=328415 RepID=UPI001CBF77C0|nr:metallophosphoesterase [Tateyamaria pelophila]
MFRQWLARLGKTPYFPPVTPEYPFSAIGDIHGRADLLERALRLSDNYPVVCVGDYVDRGDNSADVLRMLYSRPDIVCISGNHEEMMLDFIEAPDKNGSRWLRFGGLQTLASFGVAGVTEISGDNAMTSARDQLVEAMGQPLIRWMQALPTLWQSGNVAVVHAGADPAIAIDEQTVRSLHWGQSDFAKISRTDGVWVIHGHTIVDTPLAQHGRISIDTGAYATGRLSLAHVELSAVHFEIVT